MDENMGEKGNLPIMAFPSRETWAAWLDTHHTDSVGIWLAFAKKGAGEASVSYSDAVEVALCYGWIDGQAGSSMSASGCSGSPRAGHGASGRA